MRSRLWSLILRELPPPLRWVGTEIFYFSRWLDQISLKFARGLRDDPAWYFVTSVGTLAIGLTVLLFISLIHETSGQRPDSIPQPTVKNFSREELELNHDWSVQDRWRLAHLFLMDRPQPKPNEIPLDSRLVASKRSSPLPQKRFDASSSRRRVGYQTGFEKTLDVRLDLSRPQQAQQGNRIVRGTVLDPGSTRTANQQATPLRPRESRLLVQASWGHSTECANPLVDSYADYAPRPVRRPVLIPRPEPEIQTPDPIVRRETPNLAFELALVRHFSVAGIHPPDSHLVSRSNHSSYPDHEHRFPSELVSHEEGPWKIFNPGRDQFAAEPARYLGIGVYDPSARNLHPSDEYDETLRAVADVALRLKLETPEEVAAGQLSKSRLLITNDGPDPVSRIEIREFLADLQTVVAAVPQAKSESTADFPTNERGGTLHRELLDLAPGDLQEMSLQWVPGHQTRQIHRALVIAHAEVSTSTNVIQPDPVQQMPSIPPERLKHHFAAACDIQHLDRVTVGKEISLEMTIRNTGNTSLHRIKVEIEIPDQLSHREGRSVVYDVGTLPVAGQKQTLVKLSARQAGEAVYLVHVTADESVSLRGRNVIQVVEPRSQPNQPIPATRTVPQPVSSPPVSQPVPLIRSAPDACCCPNVTMLPPNSSTPSLLPRIP